MPEEAICRRCEKWELVPGDQYCAWCGETVFGLRLDCEGRRVLLDGGGKAGEAGPAESGRVQLRLENSGQWAAEVALEADQPWLKLPDDLKPVAAGQWIEFNALVDRARAPKEDFAAAVVTAVSDDAQDEIILEFLPRPRLVAELRTGALYLDENAETVPLELTLQKGVLELTSPDSVSSGASWAEVSWPAGAEFPLTIDARKSPRQDLELTVDKAALAAAVEHKRAAGEKSVPLRVDVKDKHFGDVGPVEAVLEVRWPALLVVQGADFDEVTFRVLVGRQEEHAITIRNAGDEPLNVSSLKVEAEWLLLKVPKVPFKLDPGGSVELMLTADASDIGVGDNAGSLTIESDSFGNPAKRIELRLHVFEEEYQGIVSFDFGTTNSCVVVFDQAGGEPEVVVLDPTVSSGYESQTIPSVILYEEFRETPGVEPRVYEVGRYAERYAAQPECQESFVRSVKRFVGQPIVFPIRFWRDNSRADLSPETVAGDVVARLVDMVEGALKQKVQACVVTHPSRFSPLQLAALRKAFEHQGLKVSYMIQEPVAAALDYIVSHEGMPDYHMLVCDFGGGTTDFALLHVNDVVNDGVRRVKPEVLTATACRHFGGDDITDAVASHFAAKGAEELGPRGVSVPTIHLAREELYAIADVEARGRALRNHEAIRRTAEEAKIACSREPGSGFEADVALVNDKNEESSFRVRLDDKLLRRLSEKSVSDAVALSRKLVRGALGKTVPEVVLMAGRASGLPVVREKLTAAFKDASIAFAGQEHVDAGADAASAAGGGEGVAGLDLKQCVSKGAAVLAKILEYPFSIEIDYSEMKPVATARVGIESGDTKGNSCFKPIIELGEPLGRWKAVKEAKPGKILVIYENAGDDDSFIVNDKGKKKRNADIRQLAVFDLDGKKKKAKEWAVEMQLNAVHQVLVRINGDVVEGGQVFG